MGHHHQFYVKLIHCGNVNLTNPEDQEQKNIFFMPMGLFPLANTLAEHDFEVEIIHLDLNSGQTITDILDFNHLDAVGFDCHWANQSLVVLDTARLLKKLKPELFIFLGGFTASLFAAEIVASYPEINAVIRGDGEIPIVELCQALKTQTYSPEVAGHNLAGVLNQVQNLVWRDPEGQLRENPFSYQATPQNMEDLDFAAIDLLRDWEYYRTLSRFWTRFEPIASTPLFLLEVGRGCPYACTFCGGNCEAQRKMNHRTATIIRSPESVMATIHKALPFGFETFYTSFEFEGSDPWFIDLFSRIKAEGLKINFGYGCWRIPSRELIDALSESFGQVIFEISPETGDMELRRTNKDIRLFYTNEALEECLDYINTKKNIKVQLFFGYFLAGDTEETITNTISYILRLIMKYPGLLEIEYSNFSTDPGSLFFFHPEKYDIEIKARRFDDYLRYIEEFYIIKKRQPADMTLFRPRNISPEKITVIFRKFTLLAYLFHGFRRTVSRILTMTQKGEFVTQILAAHHSLVAENNLIAPQAVKNLLVDVCNQNGILSAALLKLIDSEYEAQLVSQPISKPTTQFYLEDDNDLAVQEHELYHEMLDFIEKNSNSNEDLAVEFDLPSN